MSKKYISVFDDPQFDKYNSIFDDPQFDILNQKPKKKEKPIEIKYDNINNVLENMKYKQLKALAKFHNLHYRIKLNSRDNVITALKNLYNYKNDIYSSKPFNMVLKDNEVKQSVNITKRNKDD
jgi:hypothetical protein